MSLSRLHDRLHNWSRWCRKDEESARSCIAGFWSKWIPSKGWDLGWGDMTGPEPEDSAIDDVDAETIDGFVWQLSPGPRAALIRRYVHGHRAVTPTERDSLRNAIDALAEAMGENVRTVRHMRILCRGRA